jgi:hypothetical protein
MPEQSFLTDPVDSFWLEIAQSANQLMGIEKTHSSKLGRAVITPFWNKKNLNVTGIL